MVKLIIEYTRLFIRSRVLGRRKKEKRWERQEAYQKISPKNFSLHSHFHPTSHHDVAPQPNGDTRHS